MIQAEQYFKERFPEDYREMQFLKIRFISQLMEEYANQYKELLSKYIQHVEECEGTNFINCTFSEVNFTDNELKLLKELAEK
jgi:hypothetical protein